MRLYYSKRFLKEVSGLPKRHQEKLARLLEYAQKDPFDERLSSKPLRGNLTGVYSLRITREYRVLFHFAEPTVIHLLSVKHRKDIYR